ncbi:peptidoglycan-binding protein [Patescibacteria group bacterium]|nr:peptidoglycan-binding protein [Patescibacteria group bacterium]
MVFRLVKKLFWLLLAAFIVLSLIKNPTLLNKITRQVNPTSNQLISPVLKIGSTGDEVRILQAAFSQDGNLYPEGIVSGYFGQLTEKAVKTFQTKNNLPVTGVVDTATAAKFNENYGYENKDYYLKLKPVTQLVLNVNNQSALPNLGEWGKATQISAHTWTMNVGMDAHMATPQEILVALNNYRQKHGRNGLVWDDRLAKFAQSRAAYFTQIGNLDDHAGFTAYVQNPGNDRALGYSYLGENSSYGYQLEGVHLIEWVYAGDKPHDDNQLNPDWTHVGIGVDATQTDLIFAADPIQ